MPKLTEEMASLFTEVVMLGGCQLENAGDHLPVTVQKHT